MRINDVMSTAVRTVHPDDDVQSAWTLMSTANIHHLVVLDGKTIVGVVSKRDLGGRRGPKQRQRIRDVMSDNVITVAPDAPIKRAANLMRGRSLGCLPVVADSGLVGILTTSDLLEVIGRGTEKPNGRGKRYTLTHPHPTAPHR